MGSNRGRKPDGTGRAAAESCGESWVSNVPIVVGHSYGGAVALAWGLSQPDQTAALVTLGGVSNPWPGELDRLYKVTGSAVGGATVVPLITALAPEKRIETAVASIFRSAGAAGRLYVDYIGAELTLRREALRANGQQVKHPAPAYRGDGKAISNPPDHAAGNPARHPPMIHRADKCPMPKRSWVTQAPARQRLTRLPGDRPYAPSRAATCRGAGRDRPCRHPRRSC